MDKVIIFGASDTGKRIYQDIKMEMDILFFVDEDSSKWETSVDGVEVKAPDSIIAAKYDYIFIGVLTYYHEVMQYLKKIDVPMGKIIGRYVEVPTFARIECLKNIRDILDESEINSGNVAELGVYRGDFAKEINKVFKDRKLYLFDTFEGFYEMDVAKEHEEGYSKSAVGYFSNTTEELVLSKMLYPNNIIIKKGYFPNSASDVDDMFCFVNLDVDLYAPTLAGLHYFYPRMVAGGFILVHDYFSKAFSGARVAVKEFSEQTGCKPIPIGDSLSVAIRK